MKKALYAFAISLIILLASCGVKSDEVVDYQQKQSEADTAAEEIKDYLLSMDEIEECNVRIDGDTAVVSINLAENYGRDDAFLIGLKYKIIADIKLQNAHVRHVAVTTAPDIFDRLHEDERESAEEDVVEKKLEKNAGKEIFNNVVPTV